MLAYSHSRIKNFNQCRKRFWHTVVAPKGDVMRVTEPSSPAQDWGKRVHKALEVAISTGQPLIPELAQYEPLVAVFRDKPDLDIHTEQQMAINHQLMPVDWFDREVICRAIADVLAIHKKNKLALYVDWKTGKTKDTDDQLYLTLCLILFHHPEVISATGSYAYLHDKTFSSPVRLDRADLSDCWAQWSRKGEEIWRAERENAWTPRAGRHCRWCPVNAAKMCQYAEG